MSAYCLGDYEQAMGLGRGPRRIRGRESSLGNDGARCRLGFALVALGNLDRARERFRWALEQAQATEAKSLALLALSGVGVLLAREGEERRAVELLTFVFGYPGFPPFYFITAQPELDRLEGELAPAELAAARGAAKTADLEAMLGLADGAVAGELSARPVPDMTDGWPEVESGLEREFRFPTSRPRWRS